MATTTSHTLNHQIMTPSTRLPRVFVAGLVPLLCVFFSGASGQSLPDSTTKKAADSTKIVALIDAMQTAWNTHDMHALANLFHEDGTWILWDGKIVWKGRSLIEEGHAKAHKTVYRNSIQTKQIEEITFVGPDAAVVRTHDTLTGDERYPAQVVESRKFLVCTRKNAIWKIGWGQNTRYPEFTTKK